MHEPERYLCRVYAYTQDRRELLVEVVHETKQDERFYIGFLEVTGFSGMMQWQGAVLRLGSDEEYLQFMQVMLTPGEVPDTGLIDREKYGNLYIFEGAKRQVRLVALYMEQLKTLW